MDSRELKLAQEIRDSFGRMLPFIGTNDSRVSVDGNFIQIEVRHLGEWITDEQDAYYREQDDEYDYSWREDNDQMIWAPGEYSKYLAKFTDWAKKFDWYQFATLSLSTSEKHWCEFGIEVKLPPINAKLQTLPAELEAANPMLTLGDFWTNMGHFLYILDTSGCKTNVKQAVVFAYEYIIQKGSTRENFDNLAMAVSTIFSMDASFVELFDGYADAYRNALSQTLRGLSREQKIEAVSKKLRGQTYLGITWK